MRRLSGTDAMFLSAETPAWHQHVGGLTILDTSTNPEVSFETVRENLAARIELVPKLRWKLKGVPLGLDRPVWVEDRGFDLDRHLRRVGVPPPGGPRETAALVGLILSYQLDRHHPLWELWYLDGLVNDRVALVMKYHHCMLDGVAGAGLATVLLDLEQHPAEPPIPAEGNTEGAGREPSDLELLTRGLFHAGTTPVRAIRFGGQLARRAVSVVGAAREGVLPPVRSPRTSLNRSIGAQRAFAFTSVSLDDVKRIRRHFDAAFDDADGTGVKVNDVFLALCAGALRRHLDDLGELPEAPLSCGVPVSTREAGDTSLDNRVGFMIVSLATDEADPAARLRAIATSSRRAKDFTRAIRSTPLASVGETAPPFVVGPAIRLAYEARLLGRMPAVVNTLVSNVPGPPFDLWSVGARVAGIFSTSVIMEGMGLNVTLFTYGDRVDFGLHVDPEQVPDPWAIADRIPEALAELLAAGGLGTPTPVEDAFGITAPVGG